MSAAEREDRARALFHLTLANIPNVSWRRADARCREYFRALVDREAAS